MIVAFYEGTIDEGQSNNAGHPVFGRSLYANYDDCHYLGYTRGMERHGKGIYVCDDEVMA